MRVLALASLLSIVCALNAAEVRLVTIGPGDLYWEVYGHTAVWVTDERGDRVYGFGYFDFNQDDFFINFVRGRMLYFMAATPPQAELGEYRRSDRDIYIQTLNLEATQKQALIDRLMYLDHPERRQYRYNYFTNNCTSIVRDLLDEALQGRLKAQFAQRPAGHSWYDATMPALNQGWMNLGMAMGYGWPAHSQRSEWEQMAFPLQLMRHLADTTWATEPRMEYQSTRPVDARYSAVASHWPMVLLVAVLLAAVLWPRSRAGAIWIWLHVQALIGVLLLVLWLGTEHTVAGLNFNALLFFPGAVLLRRVDWGGGLFIAANALWLGLAVFVGFYYLIGFWLINAVIIWLHWRHGDSGTA